jgi:hypothetical protein
VEDIMKPMQDEKQLPQHKKDALADKVADDIHKQVTRTMKELRDHEVSKTDAGEIIGAGIRRGVDRVNEDLNKE